MKTPPAPSEPREMAVFHARVPVELHEAARIQAIREKRHLEKLVEDAVRRYLQSVDTGDAA